MATRFNRGFALTWLGHSTVKLVTRGNKTILMEPWVEGNPACPQSHKAIDKIDIMTISHGHGDHMGDAVTLAKKHKPTIVCIYEIHAWLQRKGVNTTSPMNKGGTQEVAGIRISMTNAFHSSGIEDGSTMIEGGDPCGYVIVLEDGTRIYHAGDTCAFSDMALIRELHEPEIALLPIGDLYTMSPREAAIAARLLQPKYIVPIHHGTFPALTGTPAMLEKELEKLGVKSEVIALRPGETLT